MVAAVAVDVLAVEVVVAVEVVLVGGSSVDVPTVVEEDAVEVGGFIAVVPIPLAAVVDAVVAAAVVVAAVVAALVVALVVPVEVPPQAVIAVITA